MPVNLQNHSHGDEGDEARIEIVPLIDIMFFLLAAFMLVSLSMTHLNRVPIHVPKASTGQPQTKTPPVQIAVDANGVTTWEQQIVTPGEIVVRLRSIPDHQNANVMISADENARHRQVLAVINAIREAGVEKISFETKSE